MAEFWSEIPILSWANQKLSSMPGKVSTNSQFLNLFQSIVIVHAGQRVFGEKKQCEKDLVDKVRQ